MEKTIEIPEIGVIVTLSYANGTNEKPAGAIVCNQHTDEDEDEQFNLALDGITSLILAHACAGIDITSTEYVSGAETAIEGAANNL